MNVRDETVDKISEGMIRASVAVALAFGLVAFVLVPLCQGVHTLAL